MATNFSDLLNKQSNTTQEAATSNIPANEKLTAAEFVRLVSAVRDNNAIADMLQKPNHQIVYTSTNGKIVTPNNTDGFGANIVSNTYENGRGVLFFDGPVTSIGRWGFDSCSNLKSIILPDSLISIDAFAFSYCSGLVDVFIPNSVKSIGECAFSMTNNLENIIIPGSVTSIDTCLFEYSGVKTITLLEGVTSISTSAFSSCSNLVSVSLPNSLISIGSSAFQYCERLKSIVIPDSVTSIGSNAFYFCSSLHSVKLSNNLKVLANGLFDSCPLVEVEIPCQVTQIADYAFANCDKLSNLTIPEKVTQIGKEAFSYAGMDYDYTTGKYIVNLNVIYFKSETPPTLGENTFNGLDNCKFCVPYNSVDAYKAATDWSAYADRIVGYHYDAGVMVNDIADEITRAQAKEKELSDAINSNSEAIGLNFEDINNEVERATQVENDIKAKATHYNTLHFSQSADHVTLSGKSIDGNNTIGQDIPAATAEKAGVMSAEDKKEQVKMTPLVNGDIITGQAREIYSRNGKTVTGSFLARTTAGSGTIGDGVASLKSVGGNIVKNLVDGTFDMVLSTSNNCKSHSIVDNVLQYTTNTNDTYGGIAVRNLQIVVGHKYYLSACAKDDGETEAIIGLSGVTTKAVTHKSGNWELLSDIQTATSTLHTYNFFTRTPNKTEQSASFKTPLLIDLTEMFGAGKEPDQATCDRLFGTMDALPQGLTVANPTEFKSTGFNQFNPDNILEGKAIVDNAIVDGDKKIAVIPCLPCKIGVGENNGYCIHGDFGEDIKVYLTPLNPLEVEGELYLCELTKDADKGTYVPQIKGYMLVEVPTTANLCAHFLWSEDKCERDTYEPYFESKVELPTIPQMSEWGLAGIQSSGTLACDEIDFVKGVYRKKIGAVDMGSLNWTINTKYPDIASVAFPQKANGCNLSTSKYITLGKGFLFAESSTYADKVIAGTTSGNGVYVKDGAITTVDAFKSAMQGVILYYELAEPEEHSLPKVDNNYISSDYGVEQFDSVVPCNANNLYYMRSLAGETRNFLDRLMAGLGTSDATVVADRILAVVNPVVNPANVEPETAIEE